MSHGAIRLEKSSLNQGERKGKGHFKEVKFLHGYKVTRLFSSSQLGLRSSVSYNMSYFFKIKILNID